MTIARRLILLLALPLVALLAMGVFTRLQLNKIEERSRFVAESRIVALATLGNFSRHFVELRVDVRNHLLATNQVQRVAARTAFDANEQIVKRLLAQYADELVVSDQGRRLLSEYQTLFRDWTLGARDVMVLSDEGRLADAAALLSGPIAAIGGRLSSVAKEWIQNNEELAKSAGHEALNAIEESRWKMLAGNSAAMLLTGLLGFLTFRRIVRPIQGLEASVQAIAAGDYAQNVPFTEATDETGGLARSIDVLKRGAAATDEQRWVKAGASQVTGELQGADTLAAFGQRLLSGLVPRLGGGVAGFYLFEEKPGRLRRIAGYGLAESATADSCGVGEGLVGQCAQERKPVRLHNLPPGYLQIASGLGGAAAAQAVAMPLLSANAVLGVLEIASFRAFQPREQALLEEVLPVVGMSLEILQRNLRTQELLEQTQEQARELEEQTAELTQSQEELLAQKEELLTQQAELTTQREQLTVSEERSRLILESSAEGIFGVDTEGRITFVNPAACRLLGFSPEELIHQPSHAVIHHHRPDGSDYPMEQCPMFAAYKHGKASRVDDEFLWRKDGSGLPVEYGATPMLKNGAVVGAVISFTDITQRKLQEAELQTQHSALESAANAIAITDRRGVIQWVNPAFTMLTGYTREEAIGQNPRVLKSGVHEPEFYAKMWRTVLAGSVWQGTLTNKRKDGVLYQEEMTITPVRTRRGEITHFVAVKQDITERIHAEAELRQRTDDLQHTNFLSDSALDLTKAGYWHVPLDGSGWYNSSARAARIFGDLPAPDHRYRLDEWAAHVREGDEEAAKVTLENFSAAVAGTIPAYDTIYAYKRPIDGRVVWIHALGHVVKDPSGKPTDMYGVTQDITEFKLLESELVGAKQKAEEATQMKSMFLANMSHEIRTPMNAIIGLSHLALKTPLNPKQRDYLSKVHNAGTSLLAIINDILDFSKIEAGKLDIETTDLQLDEVIGSVTTVTAQKAHDKGLEFLVDIASAIPESLRGDPLRLGQILINLVNNAVKFTERGEIRLKIELQEQTGEKVQLKFSVRDTGIGMTKEQAGRLFQAFSQADMSTTRKHGGTGLGLTICRRLVELMGGQIWLESEPGVGSTFAFTIWLGLGQATGAGQVVPSQFQNLRVLVVDDNAAAREILVESLGSLAEQVDAVSSGHEALAAIKERDTDTPYDVIFMDWRMPGLDGLQTARLIKNDTALRKQPAIVIVTAFGREEVREEAEKLDVDGFLVKPVTKSMLVDSLVHVFARTEGEAAVTSSGVKEESTRLQGLRILLTEDNEINQQIAVELLEGVGATITVANNGREAVDKLCQGPIPPPFDLVLMDLQMPEMDGYQATTKIRGDSRFASLPIIAMTAHATIEERQRCLAAGMNDHVSKPIDPALLFDTLTRFYRPATLAAAGLPAGSAENRPAVPQPPTEELPVLEGLDTKDGLGRVAGNRKLYLKLLRQFVDQQGPAHAQIGQALAAGDSALAERLAHTVKGVAGSLGAPAVQRAAGSLEKAITAKATAADLKTVLHNFTKVLTDFVERLAAALPAPAVPAVSSVAAAPLDPEAAKRVVQEMMGHLNNFDPAAAECLDVNRPLFQALMPGQAFSAFDQQVSAFSFGEALAGLQAAATEKGLLLL